MLSANRHGVESHADGAQQFWGNSFIVGPQGEWLAHAPADQDALLCVDLDRSRSETVRRIWPFLRDRRVDAYHDLTRRYRDPRPAHQSAAAGRDGAASGNARRRLPASNA